MNFVTDNWRAKLGAFLSPIALPEAGDDSAVTPPVPVLIVDDDIDWATECAFSLRTLGCEPLVARSPDEAMKLFLSHEVAIAIVDYNLPGQDGITLIHELGRTAEAQGRRLHFIVVTGYATKDVAIDAMRASAVDFLEKPVRPIELRKALQRINGLRDTPAARETLTQKLSNLSIELQRLSHLIDDPDQPRSAGKPAASASVQAAALPAGGLDTPQLADFIRELLKKEAKRREIGGGELFGDPAWEMLLDLLLAKVEGRQVSVSSACIASGAPMSTALRLVRRLVDEGVLRKLADETDRRRHFLAIGPQFEQPLIDYLIEQLRQRTAADQG
ncbi:MAG TPA: response regulator [Novosphingobium sp.]